MLHRGEVTHFGVDVAAGAVELHGLVVVHQLGAVDTVGEVGVLPGLVVHVGHAAELALLVVFSATAEATGGLLETLLQLPSELWRKKGK